VLLHRLTAASLVALQSVPGLVVLYAGWVKHKWAINSAFMAFYAFSAVLICWVLWAYKMGFGEYMLPFVGIPGPAVDIGYQLRHSWLPSENAYQAFPQATMVYFQFVFAAITLVLIAGSYLCRMNFYVSPPFRFNKNPAFLQCTRRVIEGLQRTGLT
jgi:Amt family ammonium transporter